MEMAMLFLGISCGVVIGLEYYKYQITRKKNPKVIARVKGWLEESER